MVYVWNLKGLRQQKVEKIKGFENLSLWQKLISFKLAMELLMSNPCFSCKKSLFSEKSIKFHYKKL